MCSEDVNRGRSSGAGRVARRSFAGWALVASARQGGELAPFGRSDSAALPPRLRSSHPAEFASGHAPRARGPSPPRGRQSLSGGRVRLIHVHGRNPGEGADEIKGHALFAQLGKKGVSLNFTRMCNKDRPRCTWKTAGACAPAVWYLHLFPRCYSLEPTDPMDLRWSVL